MTKRDYLMISRTVRHIRSLKTTDEDTLDLLAYAFANELGRNNKQFDKPRFMADCGCPA